MSDRDFAADMKQLIHPQIEYDFNQACDLIMQTVVQKLPGEPWKKTNKKLSVLNKKIEVEDFFSE